MEYNGVYNKFNYRNVGKYEGQRKNSRQEGTGTFYYANGDTYIGQWRNDLMGLIITMLAVVVINASGKMAYKKAWVLIIMLMVKNMYINGQKGYLYENEGDL